MRNQNRQKKKFQRIQRMYVGFNNGLVLASRFFSFFLDSDNVNNKKKEERDKSNHFSP